MNSNIIYSINYIIIMLNIISIIIDSYIPHLGNVNTEFSNKYVFYCNTLCFKNNKCMAYNWRGKNITQYIYGFIYTSNGDHMIKTDHMLLLCLRK